MNPPCKYCNAGTVKAGREKSGSQRYHCRSCGKRFSLNPRGRPPGKTPALTGAQRARLYRDRLNLLEKIINKIQEVDNEINNIIRIEYEY